MSSNFRGLDKIAWLMIIGSGISRGAFYMAFPFLAFHLKNRLGADITTIGWIIGAGPLMGAIVGFYGGYLSDLFGRRSILIGALTIWGFTQMSFAFANSIFIFGVLSGLNGILRAIAEPIAQAVISDRAKGEAKERAYHYRYYAVNIGAAVGPILGGALLIDHPSIAFAIAGGSLVLFALAFAIQTKGHPRFAEETEKPPGFGAVMKLLAKDRTLNYFVFASILTAVAYSQTETALPLILNDIFKADGAKMFGWLIAANGITIVICQLWLNKVTRRFNTVKTVALSCFVFGLGLFGFGFSANMWWAYMLSMIVLALGEILVFSNGYILIDRLAPAHLRGTYHSAANMFSIGLAFGPPFGAWILKHAGQEILFTLMAGLLFFCSWIYVKGGREA